MQYVELEHKLPSDFINGCIDHIPPNQTIIRPFIFNDKDGITIKNHEDIIIDINDRLDEGEKEDKMFYIIYLVYDHNKIEKPYFIFSKNMKQPKLKEGYNKYRRVDIWNWNYYTTVNGCWTTLIEPRE